MDIKLKGCTGEDFAKRAFKLLYDACGHAVGMGVFQARDNVSESDVWENVRNAGDYPGGVFMSSDGDAYGDYVFGRRIKWGCKFTKDTVTIPDREFDVGYQGFARIYKDNVAIVEAVVKSLDAEYEIQTDNEQ